MRPLRFLSVVLFLLSLGGCASLRQTAAGWLGQEPVPATVAGIGYAAIRDLGALKGTCAHLQDRFRAGEYVSASRLRDHWLPACAARIEAARQARRDALASLAGQFEAGHQAIQRAQQRQAERERRRAAQAWARAQAQAQQRARARRAAAPPAGVPAESLPTLAEQLKAAQVHRALAEVPDRPLAYAVGQPSSRTMKNFLACLELGYPAGTYVVNHDAGNLVVTARGAVASRGHVDIRAQFRDLWDTWVLTALSVGQIRAVTPRDRFDLAQRLLAGSPCD